MHSNIQRKHGCFNIYLVYVIKIAESYLQFWKVWNETITEIVILSPKIGDMKTLYLQFVKLVKPNYSHQINVVK